MVSRGVYPDRKHLADVAGLGESAALDLKIVQAAAPGRPAGQAPFLDVLFNFESLPEPRLAFADVAVQPVELAPPLAKCPLTCYVDDRPGGLRLRFRYQAALFSSARMATLLDQYRGVLESVARSVLAKAGMTLDEIRALIALRESPAQDCGEVNALLDEHIGHVAHRIRELRALEKDLKSLRARCASPHALADCGILNGLDRAAAAPAAPAKRRHVHGAH